MFQSSVERLELLRVHFLGATHIKVDVGLYNVGAQIVGEIIPLWCWLSHIMLNQKFSSEPRSSDRTLRSVKEVFDLMVRFLSSFPDII